MFANILQPPFTCPACGLLCDDITPSNNTCAKSIAFFGQGLGNTSPQIKGIKVNLEEAVAQTVTLLKASQRPVFAGLSTDIAGFKAIHNLAQKSDGAFRNITLQHINATSMARNIKVLQNTGWQTTTLGEVKNRADLIVCIGSDIATHNPRFFERFVDVDGMFISAKQREVVHIGNKTTALKGAWILPCSDADLPNVLSALHALVLGQTLKANQIASINLSDLQTLASKLKVAKYAVLTWIAKDLDFNHAELTIEQITQIVATLNQTTRAAGIPLGGSDGDTSTNNVHTWQTGQTLLETEYTKPDLQIWINSFNFEAPPTFCHTPTIILGNANTTWAEHADVFIPVATPGLDCAGTMFRVDSSVILPLKKVRENNLPTLAEIARQIEAELK